jgi:hypothetical protein
VGPVCARKTVADKRTPINGAERHSPAVNLRISTTSVMKREAKCLSRPRVVAGVSGGKEYAATLVCKTEPAKTSQRSCEVSGRRVSIAGLRCRIETNSKVFPAAMPV